MPTNQGGIDRILRITAGFVILMLLPVSMWGFLGLIPLISGLLGFCPVYALVGFRTCPPLDAA
jgi:hypothetical protein